MNDAMYDFPSLRIGPATVGAGYPVYVIAEAGVNHDGDVGLACEMIHAAADAGADAVKFQVFSADRLVTRSAPAAQYQKRAAHAGTQYEMLARLQLSWEDFAELAAYAGRQDIEFLATPFSVADLDFLVSIKVRALKLASPDIVNTALVERAAKSGLPVIASTGAADLEEIAAAVECFRLTRMREGLPASDRGADTLPDSQCGLDACSTEKSTLAAPLALLHCVSSYPAREDEANLAAIGTLARAFHCVSGFSDHTESVAMGGYAVAAGARIIEKHFTLDRTRPGPDHAFSLEPEMLAEYIRHIRQAERFVGNGRIEVSNSQREVRQLARGSIVAARHIRAGEALTRSMLTIKRPGGGIAPAEMEHLIGRHARLDIPADTALAWEAVL
ncbi:MAG TPA: N-acetylneuraminate synthase family protein [Phycisphaerae bacterium]|nr:N-acetylneuraminate synthase [Phycisphaerae bacterium]HOB73481.1 N-acetylneuraminate synthase family protein [Phycisphaerae bacterium]HOJ54089.1 N-acetylneuraminate synthase family protein [Phycisphaerae bacterium]HOL25618.1 N-acetylneuraminate synthase family protein [Phycisphaerae bacterium]HPP22745.1 N-acetylneuraminate synthase family protein [Phycisphaerae bacterium]